jgi:uncharacterized protein with gpF-like domain
MKEHVANVVRILVLALPRIGMTSAVGIRENLPKSMQKQLLDTQEALLSRVVKAAKKRSVELSASIGKTTAKRIASVVSAGLEANDTTAVIARSIHDEVGGMSISRARTIARTESAIASQSGQHASMVDASENLGMPMEKTWVATSDDATRETHAEADGQTVDMNAAFVVGDSKLLYPSDPDGPLEEVINCRCGVVYDPK